MNNNGVLDSEDVRKRYSRKGFDIRSFINRYSLTPVGAPLFRTKWDEGTAGVMARANLPEADIEWHRKKREKLPYKKKDGERYR